MSDKSKFEKEVGFEVKGALMVIDDEGIVHHFCGYEHKPDQKDVDALFLELSMDKEFGLTETIESLHIVEPDEESLTEFLKEFDTDEEGVVTTVHDAENEEVEKE